MLDGGKTSALTETGAAAAPLPCPAELETAEHAGDASICRSLLLTDKFSRLPGWRWLSLYEEVQPRKCFPVTPLLSYRTGSAPPLFAPHRALATCKDLNYSPAGLWLLLMHWFDVGGCTAIWLETEQIWAAVAETSLAPDAGISGVCGASTTELP